jgi:hypothetical protein
MDIAPHFPAIGGSAALAPTLTFNACCVASKLQELQRTLELCQHHVRGLLVYADARLGHQQEESL